MNTNTYTNASQLPLIWFELSDIAISNGGRTARKSSGLNDFAHLIHKLDDLHQSRATFVRATDRSIDMLTTALNALRKNKTHITDEYIERVIDDLVAARNTIK